MQLHRRIRRDAWIFFRDYGRLMGVPYCAVGSAGLLPVDFILTGRSGIAFEKVHD
jgi:hypothetical protein